MDGVLEQQQQQQQGEGIVGLDDQGKHHQQQHQVPQVNYCSPDMSPTDAYSLFRAPSLSFSSATTSGASFSSVDDTDAVSALPAISRDFAKPLKNDDARRPKTAGGLLQTAAGGSGWGAFAPIDEQAQMLGFQDPFEVKLESASSISPSHDPMIDPHAQGRRASEPRFNFGQGLVSLPSHGRFLEANNVPHTSPWQESPQLSSATFLGVQPYPIYQHPPPRAISTAELRPQTSDGLPSYLSQPKMPPPTMFAGQAQSRRPNIGINGLPSGPNTYYQPPRSAGSGSSSSYMPSMQYAPVRSQSLDHSRYGRQASDTRPQQQQQQQQRSGSSGGSQLPKKRPRRRFDEIERLYNCGYQGCEKAYGTLNHLNAHVTMQKHGEKRLPGEFKALRKAWRKRKREQAENGDGQGRSGDEMSSDDVHHPGRRESDVPASAEPQQHTYFRSAQPPLNWIPGSRPYEDSSRPTSSSSVASSTASEYGSAPASAYAQPQSYLPPPHFQRRQFAPSHVAMPLQEQTFHYPHPDYSTPTQLEPHRGAGAGVGGAYPFQTLSMGLPSHTMQGGAGGAYALLGPHQTQQSQFAFNN